MFRVWRCRTVGHMKSKRQRLKEWVQRHTTHALYVRLLYYYTVVVKLHRVPELLNLRNPKNWNAKLNYLKVHIDRLIPDAHLYADKLTVRDYVAEAIGDDCLVPLLGSWETAEEIEWSSLPDSFVLKTNHGSGFNVIVRDRSELDVDRVTDQLNSWLEIDYSLMGGEKHYRRIPRRVLAEELLGSGVSDVPDYKFYCFDGKPGFVEVIFDRHSDPWQRFLDMDWNSLPFKGTKALTNRTVERPAALGQMVSIAETLAAPFFFVRVDLYEVEESVFFGELSFIPGGGVSMSPRSWNRKLGDLIRLPE